MADEANDVSNEISLDDFNADEQAPAKADPSPAPKDEPAEKLETAEDKAPPEGKTDDTAPDKAETETEDDSPEDEVEDTETQKPESQPEDKPEDKPQKGAETRKEKLNTEIRDLVAQRNALREQVEKANSEVYQPATEDELTEQGMSEIEAKVEAMRQERELEKYNNQVAEVQLTLGHESQRVLQDFPIFNKDSDQYDAELAEEAAELLADTLIVDENTNQIIGYRQSPYKLYKTLARASGLSAVKGEIKGQQNTEQQLANVDAPPSAAPAKKPVDPLVELWKADD